MMKFIRQAPFLRVLLPFIVGIVGYGQWEKMVPVWFLLLALLTGISWILFQFVPFNWRLKLPFIEDILTQLFIVEAGFLISAGHDHLQGAKHYSHYLASDQAYIVRVKEAPLRKPKTICLEIEILKSIDCFRQEQVRQGYGLIYLHPDSKAVSVRRGDQLLIKNQWQAIQPTKNPGSFDYPAYLKNKSTYHRAFYRNTGWRKLVGSELNWNDRIQNLAENIRRQIKKNMTDSSAYGLAEALLVGYRRDIDSEQMQEYSQVGLAHLIAISGMHMALIYSGLLFLLGKIPQLKRKINTQIILALIGMWFFALLTGLPPSVLRAAVMFTFIGWAKLEDRHLFTLNSVLGSACVLLFIQPKWLYDIGFQLSYLAVLSLIIFYPILSRKISKGPLWLKPLTDLVSGTLAAQIVTLPLCLYYFHQFPLLFLVSNLIAVPLTTGILYLEIVFVICCGIEPVARALGFLIQYLIHGLNYFVHWLAGFETMLSEGWWLSAWQLGIAYLFVFTFSWGAYHRFRQVILLSGFCLLVFFSSIIIGHWNSLHQKKMVLLVQPGRSSLCLIQGHTIWKEDTLPTDFKYQTYIQSPLYGFFDIKKSRPLPWSHWMGMRWMQLAGFRLSVVMNQEHIPSRPLRSNIVFLENLKWLDTALLHKQITPNCIVLDSRIPARKAEKWEHLLRQAGYLVWNINRHGALVIDF